MDEIQATQHTLTLETLEPRVKQCVLCPLSKTRAHVVFGEGDSNAEVMFVGEGPGEVEDRTGRPFVGAAGQKLDEVLASVGIILSLIHISEPTRPY